MVQLTGNMGSPPDADEALDPIELVGFAAANMTTGHNADRMVPIEPDQCLGFMCPAKSDACAACGIAKREEDLLVGYENVMAAEESVVDAEDEYPTHPNFAFDDDAYDEYSSAPLGRGVRAVLAFSAMRPC